MQLFQAWKKSFEIFKLHNLKLFCIDSFGVIWKLFQVKLFWLALFLYTMTMSIMIPLVFVVRICGSELLSRMEPGIMHLIGVAEFTFIAVLLVMMRLFFRQKDHAHFDGYWRHARSLVVLFFCVSFIVSISVIESIIFVFLATITLFYYDTPGRWRDSFFALKHAFKMVWYDLPFFCVLVGVMEAYSFVLEYMIMHFAKPALFIFLGTTGMLKFGIGFGIFLCFGFIFLVTFVLPLSFVASFYTKKIRDNSEQFLG